MKYVVACSLCLVLAAASFCPDVLGQRAPSNGDRSRSEGGTALSPERLALQRYATAWPLEARPLEAIPFDASIPRRYLEEPDTEDLGFPADTLTEAQVLRRMARIYDYQARMLAARVDEDPQRMEELLDRSMGALAVLVRQPGITDDARFRELYRSVVTEYESYYGFPDTLAMQQGDIFAFRAEAFDALNDDASAPMLEHLALPPVEMVDTEVEMTMNARVESSMKFLLSDPDKHLYGWLSRAETYFPMIEKIFAEESVPDELKYLAMIESGLNPGAKSWARAVGMWQFMAATGRAYGLQVNGWIDERRNPEKATRAAARHLRDLHRMFDGDWQLALAGYNYSPGRLRHHLRRAEARLGRKATFWDVYDKLPRETRNYVPMFIATAFIASNPQAYGVDQGYVPGPAYAYDYVPVQGMLRLEEIAGLAGCDVDAIKALNPELLGAMLPPTKDSYYVRIPVGRYETFAWAYSRLPADARRPVSGHRVQNGETLGKIARRYGVSVASLMRKNGLHSTVIRAGQHLVVPVESAEPGIELDGAADAQPMRVQYGMRSVRAISVAGTTALDAGLMGARPESGAVQAPSVVLASDTRPAEAASRDESETEQRPPSPTRVVYRVQDGDTLGAIARTYTVSVRDLQRWNDMRGTLIRAGQSLIIYAH